MVSEGDSRRRRETKKEYIFSKLCMCMRGTLRGRRE